jgi:hypothetical protein
LKKRLERLEALSHSLGFPPLGSPHHQWQEVGAVAERLDIEDLHVLVDLLDEVEALEEVEAKPDLVHPNEVTSDSSSSWDDGLHALRSFASERGESRRCQALDNALAILAEVRSGKPKG